MAKVTPAPDHSEPLVFPPVIPVSAFILGVLLNSLRPSSDLVNAVSRPSVRMAGAAILIVGLAGFAWMVVTMKRARTPIHNSATPTTLVESGPFRFTRNPMYLFGMVAYTGLALVLLQFWSLALLPVVAFVTHVGVVLKEEAYLERRFGTAYDSYRQRVRRYL